MYDVADVPGTTKWFSARLLDTTFDVSEVFGPTFQGEGPTIGRRAGFVRLAHCNLHCSWCDADYTWRFSPHIPPGLTGYVFDPAVQIKKMTGMEILDRIRAMQVWRVVVTGGEPLLQQKKLPVLLSYLAYHLSCAIEIETNGTLAPIPEIVAQVQQFNVSPKLLNSGNAPDRREVWQAIEALKATNKALFKFVVRGVGDFQEIEEWLTRHTVHASDVWIMPLGTTRAEIESDFGALADATLRRGWNLTSRLQIQAWGNERGR